jgi:Protein of unknown function (DUF3253)
VAEHDGSRLQVELAAAGVANLDGSTGERLETAILALARHRGPDKSICPSDAARAVGGAGWRELMPAARETARELARRRLVRITSGERVLGPDDHWTGPIRIRIASSR